MGWGVLTCVSTEGEDVELEETTQSVGEVQVTHAKGVTTATPTSPDVVLVVRGEEVGASCTVVVESGDRVAIGGEEYVYSVREGDGEGGHEFVRRFYTVGRKMGSGTFASVHSGRRVSGEQEAVAIKVISKAKYAHHADPSSPALRNEIQILGSLDHPNIVRLYDTVEDQECLYLVLELVGGGELFDLVVAARGGMDEDVARPLFAQMLEAVAYMHAQGVVHRDLKPENIMLTSDDPPVVKISDFGLSRMLGIHAHLGTFCGTRSYLAPELFSEDGYGMEVDMWSLGVILYGMLSNSLPFAEDAPYSVWDQIKLGLYSFPDPLFGHVSEGGRDLIRRLMQVDPDVRWSAPQALSHPWIKNIPLETTPYPPRHPSRQSSPPPLPPVKPRAPFAFAIPAAIAALDDSKGSTRSKIAAYITKHYRTDANDDGDYDNDGRLAASDLDVYLDPLVDSGVLSVSGSRYALAQDPPLSAFSKMLDHDDGSGSDDDGSDDGSNQAGSSSTSSSSEGGRAKKKRKRLNE